MYYSLLQLNPRLRQVQAEIGAPYQMHRTLLRAFSLGTVHVPRATPDAAGILFRLDEQPNGGITVLVQSHSAPDWSALNPGYLVAPPQVKQRDPVFTTGQILAFRLRANPTKRLSAGTGNIGKRVGIYKEDEQRQWLLRKGEQHGFHLLQVHIRRDGTIIERKAVEVYGESRDLILLSVQFDGILHVTDAQLLKQAVANGIGSGKAFGFGLLSLAPV